MALDSQPDTAPLFAAAVRYFGIPRERWALALARARQLGATTVASELPWGWHAPDPSVCDLDGATDARRDVAGFVRLCGQLGLRVALSLSGLAAAEHAGDAPAWLLQRVPSERALHAQVAGLPESQSDAYPAAARAWVAAISAALRPLQAPDGPIARLRLDGANEALEQWLREEGWTIPLAPPRGTPRAALAAGALGPSLSAGLLESSAPALDALVRSDGSARPRFWRARMARLLLGATIADFARARLPGDLPFDDLDAPAAWADAEGIALDIRYGATYTYLFVENQRATSYTGLLAYRAPDSSVLHLHIGLGAGRGGLVLLREDEVAGVAIDGDASEGGWLARGLRTSAIFPSGAGCIIPCGSGLLLTAPQGGRFQLRRGAGWARMKAHRLLLGGALLPTQLQVDASHLAVPYIVEDERGQTDMYLVHPPEEVLPEFLRGYLSAQLRARAAALDYAAGLAGAQDHRHPAERLASAAGQLDAASDRFASLADYAAARHAADQAAAAGLSALHQARGTARAGYLSGTLAPAEYDRREAQLDRIIATAAHGEETSDSGTSQSVNLFDDGR